MKYIKSFISEISWNYSWYYSAMRVSVSHNGDAQCEEQERRLQANNRQYNSMLGYPNNTIKTSKYNFFNFLPLNLFEQFQKLANTYFLILLCLQLIPEISSLAWYSTVIPLMVVLSITGVKDAADDLKRHQNDKQVNNRPVLLLVNGKVEMDKWMNVQVGDIIKLENNHPVTADIILLSSSEPYGMTYIDTAELDGETNLKVKQALSVTSNMEDNLELLSAFDGRVNCEPPNNKLDRFTGILTYKGNKYFLDHDKLLLRGCTIRNTDWCYGLVIYTVILGADVSLFHLGPDTKLMQNSGKSTFKRTHIDYLMNVLVIWIFIFLAFMCFVLAIGHGIWEYNKGNYFQTFLPKEKYLSSSFVSAILVFWSYFIILNTVVPISLYVSVEIIRLGNSYYINWDQKMYYSPRNTPAQARVTTLNEELGQVKYVFSDKTGTLTQNIMIFSKCSINGKCYGAAYDKNGVKNTDKVDFSYNKLADPKFSFYDKTLVEAVKKGDHWVHLFFLSLSLCHTVVSEEKIEGELVYQAQSPDEGALVTAARNFGFVFRSRTTETIVMIEMGKTKVYKLLAILDFSNVRKRMSVIVRTPENRLMLFCKGADTIICELLHPSCNSVRDITMEHLDEFASEGLRTLMVAYRELDDAFFWEWNKKHSEACLSLENREDELSNVYDEIEKDLMLLGTTAIEDKLQDGVPETIITLNKARIKMWILTGDKQETAVNVAYSCNIFNEKMDGVFIVEGKDHETVQKELRAARNQIKPESLLETDPINTYLTMKPQKHFRIPEEEPSGNYGLVINGCSLAFALQENLKVELLRTACMCKGVICCRMTPLQKAQVVDLVKNYKKVVTLAIGDGANDVGMIKAAHVGVGIIGQEGMQAMLSSDFTFSKFHYLRRLLLVHGRWSYNRICKFLSYFFYKNFAFTLVHFWYAFFSGFSAQTVYDNWFITFYNLIYTSLPVLGLSLFDQDVDETWSLQFPELYELGQKNLYFNKKKFVECLMHGIYTSLVVFFVPLKTISNSARNDGMEFSDYQSFSVMVQTSLLCVVTMQIALETSYWTLINHLFIWGSLGFYFCVIFFLYSNGLSLIFPNIFQFVGVARNTLKQPQVWLNVTLTVALCMLPVIVSQLFKPMFWPTSINQTFSRVRESMKLSLPSSAHAKMKHVQHERRSAYAFSHEQGFGALITSGKTLKPTPSNKSSSSLLKIEGLRETPEKPVIAPPPLFHAP